VPSVTTPSVTTPSVTTPSVTTPPVTTPTVATPPAPAPSATVTGVKTPAAKAPAVSAPTTPDTAAAPPQSSSTVAPQHATPSDPTPSSGSASATHDTGTVTSSTPARIPAGGLDERGASPASTAASARHRIGQLPERRSRTIAPQALRRTLERLDGCLSTLSPAARALLRDRAGLDGSAPTTLAGLAAQRRTSPAVVRSQLRRAVRRLRHAADLGACHASVASVDATAVPGVPAAHHSDAGGGAAPAGAADRARPPLDERSAAPSISRPQAPDKGGVTLLGPLAEWSPGVVFWAVVLTGIVCCLIAAAAIRSDRGRTRHVRGPWRRQS
jgi:hypothetical protein